MPVWEISYFAVLGATIAAMAIGTFFYLPAVAGKSWMTAIGKTEAEVRAAMKPRVFLIGILLAAAQMFVLAIVIVWSTASGIGQGVVIGLTVWLGLIFPTAAMNVLYEGRPTPLYWIYGVNGLITFVVAGAIIGWWRAM